MSDLIDRQALLDAIDDERKSLLDMGMNDAEHIVVHHARRIIEELPSVTLSEYPCEDAISRKVAIAEIEDLRNKLIELGDLYEHKYEHSAYGLDYAEQIIGKLPAVTPAERATYRKKAKRWKKKYFALKTDIEKAKAEIDSYCSDNRDQNDGLYIAMKIIDKHLKEHEDAE